MTLLELVKLLKGNCNLEIRMKKDDTEFYNGDCKTLREEINYRELGWYNVDVLIPLRKDELLIKIR